MPKTFKIATFNCASLRPRLPYLLKWLKKEKPDLIGLQEIKVSDSNFPVDELARHGWHSAVHGQNIHHGVAFLARKPIEDVACRLYPAEKEEEARLICCKFQGIPIFNSYIPQGQEIDSPKYQKKLKFLADLRDYFARRIRPDEPALWIGDMNVAQNEIDLARPAGNRKHVCFHIDARKALAETMDGVWIDLYRERVKEPGHYSFWSMRFPDVFKKDIGWRVDLILGTAPMLKRLKKIWIDKKARALPGSSDHTFVVAEFSL